MPKQPNLNKLGDAGSLKDVDARRSQKPTFEFSCVYTCKLNERDRDRVREPFGVPENGTRTRREAIRNFGIYGEIGDFR
jgi:hypothetical protein